MPPVSATITFSADDPADLGRILAALGDALRRDDGTGAGIPQTEIGSHPPSGAGRPAAWYADNASRFGERLKPNARKALELIVSEGPNVPFQRVRDVLGMEGPQLAGTLASIGAAVRALDAPAPPFKADHKRQVYSIEPDIQEALSRSR